MTFFCFLLNFFRSMFTCQHQMISSYGIFPFYVPICYRKHILYQKCTLSAIIQFHNMDNVTGSSRFFFLLYYSFIFINLTGQRYHPVHSCTYIFKTIIMRSVPCFITFEVRIGHIFKKFILYDIKPPFSSFACPHYGKSPPPYGEGLYFQPNHLYTAYWSAVNFQPDHLYTTYRSVVNFPYTSILAGTKRKVNRAFP